VTDALISDVARASARGVQITATDLRKTVRGGRCILHDVSFSVAPGELVALVGGSGAGKTTLLEALAGVRPVDSGEVLFDGVELSRNVHAFRSVLGYVPQDDIIHADLPLARTLLYAAALRLPSSSSRRDAEAAVARALDALELREQADVAVRDLSGGQRKRASIAVELLTDPHVFFLDEPTSGLDPATAAELLRSLRSLADRGSTVVFTTHSVHDLAHCDRILVLARDGHLAFEGAVEAACSYFEVDHVEEIYDRLAGERDPAAWSQRLVEQRIATAAETAPSAAVPADAAPERRPGASFVRQWLVLSRRTLETLARNRLTLAILLGSPALIVAMFVILFRPGAFVRAHPSPSAIAMILFWIAFAAFFFGLTYGLLQIVTERAIVRREYLVGQRLSAYLLAKVAVLLPFLLLVNVTMLAVLRALDRMPAASLATYVSLGVTLALDAAAALALGLLASAAVDNPSQATLALPMLCFPAVLFAGAVIPVHVMAGVGAAISTLISVRWAFEGLGHALAVRDLLLHGGSPLGPPLIRSYGNAGEAASGTYWLYLAAFVGVFLAGAWLTLVLRFRHARR
jgi:ABC-type multidrug transport system ATPase subunit